MRRARARRPDRRGEVGGPAEPAGGGAGGPLGRRPSSARRAGHRRPQRPGGGDVGAARAAGRGSVAAEAAGGVRRAGTGLVRGRVAGPPAGRGPRPARRVGRGALGGTGRCRGPSRGRRSARPAQAGLPAPRHTPLGRTALHPARPHRKPGNRLSRAPPSLRSHPRPRRARPRPSAGRPAEARSRCAAPGRRPIRRPGRSRRPRTSPRPRGWPARTAGTTSPDGSPTPAPRWPARRGSATPPAPCRCSGWPRPAAARTRTPKPRSSTTSARCTGSTATRRQARNYFVMAENRFRQLDDPQGTGAVLAALADVDLDGGRPAGRGGRAAGGPRTCCANAATAAGRRPRRRSWARWPRTSGTCGARSRASR